MPLDINTVHESIEANIIELNKKSMELDAVGESKACAIRDYDKALAIAMLKRYRSNDKIAASIIPKVAAGDCCDERMVMESCISAYKALITRINVLTATLNAKQSLFRHLQ